MAQENIKVKVLLDFVPEKQATQEMRGSLETIRKSFEGLIGEETSRSMANLLARIQDIEKIFNQIGDGPISDEVFKNVNKALLGINKDFSKLVTDLGETIDINVDTGELDKEINKMSEDVDKLKAKLETSKLAKDEKTSSVFRKEKMQDLFKKNDLLSDFDGNTTSLKIPGFGNRAEFAKVEEGLIKLRVKYTELTKATKLTAKQQKELDALTKAGVAVKLPLMESIMETVKESQRAESDAFDERLALYLKEQEELDKLISKKKIALETGGEEGKALSKATTVAEQTKQSLRGSSDSYRTQKAVDDAKRSKEPAGPTTITGEAADELIDQYFTMNAAIASVKSVARKTINVISELDKAFVSIAVVTQYSNKQVWEMYDAFSSIASSSGFTTAAIGQVASEYFRQGESYSNVILLTEAAAKAAKVAGIDASESVRYLTSAVKAYRLEASEAMLVSDKFAALAASTATDYEGLATAMSKVAAQASSSGVEMDNLMGMMATAMEVTQEAPENIGTAFKTIFARMSEIKDYGKVLEDGVDANRVEKALKMVNVELFDQNNEMRNLDQVLLEVGGQWGVLNRSQKAYIATTLAGTRQQTRLLAVLENMEVVEKNIESSRNSAGATEAQQRKNTESLAFAFNRVNVAFEQFTSNIADNKAILGFIKLFASLMENLIKFTDNAAGKTTILVTSLSAFAAVMRTILQQEKFQKFFGDLGGNLKSGVIGFKDMTMNSLKAIKSLKDLGKVSTKTGLKMAGTAAMGVAGWVGLAVAVYGAAKAMGVFDTVEESVNKKTKKLRENIEKLNAAMYDTTKTKTDLGSLVEEYEELNNKVVKTEESMSRQKEILQLIKDLDVDDKYLNLIVNSDGELNKETINKWFEDIEKELDDNFQEKVNESLKIVQDDPRFFKKAVTFDDYGEAEKLAAQMAIIIKQETDSTLEGWKKYTEEKGEVFIEFARKAALESAKAQVQWMDEEGIVYSGVDADLGDGTGIIGNKKVKMVYQHVDLEPVENYMALLEEAQKTDMISDDYLARVKELKVEYLAMNTAIYDNAKAFEGLGATMPTLLEAQEQFNVLKGHGIELDIEAKRTMVGLMQNNDIAGYLNNLKKLYEETDGAKVNFVDGILHMSDELSKISFDDVVQGLTDLENSAKKIGEVNASFENFNATSISGVMELINKYEEFPEVLELINNSIIAGEGINEAAQQSMLNADKIKTEGMLKNKKITLEAEQELLSAEIDMLGAMLLDSAFIQKLANDEEFDAEKGVTEQIISLFEDESKNYHKMMMARMDSVNEFVRLKKLAEETETSQTMTKWADRYGFSVDTVRGKSERYQDVVAGISAQLDKTNHRYATNAAQLALIDKAITKVGENDWSKELGIKTEKEGKAAKDAAESVEIYTGALNKLYTAQKKLELLNWGKSLLEAEKSFIDSKNTVKGMQGAITDLSGRTSGRTGDDMYHLLALESNELKKLIDVQDEYREDLVNKLNPALKGSYQIIDGKVIPVSKEYSKLNAEQMEEVDEFAESVNTLTDEMNKNTLALYANAQEMNNIIAARREAVIEYESLMIEAIKNEEKKQIESFKKIIDANKKYLEERKALYEQSFLDQDEEESTDDIEKKRLEVIEKLSALESAHDLTSIQKREAYKKELETINDEYNQKILERNREALIESLDNQIEFQDEVYASEEEAYQERINNAEWLEARIIQIQVNGSEAILEFLKLHHPKMELATTNMKDSLLGTWGSLLTSVEGYTNGFADLTVSVPSTSDYVESLNDLVTKTNKAASDVELAYARIRKAQSGEGDSSGGKKSTETPTPEVRERTVYYYKGRKFMVHDQAKGERQNDVGHLQTAYKKADSRKHQNQYYYDQFIEAKKALDAAEAYKITSKVERYKDGGTTERTGMHWLDGKPGAPERVLSPGQNREFERLLKTLTSENSKVQDNKEIVDSLMVVVKAVYDSSQESANEITEAIKGIELKEGGASIKSIASKHGISLNRRGDK